MYYSNQTAQYWQKNRQLGKWNGIENTDIIPHTELILDRSKTHNGKSECLQLMNTMMTVIIIIYTLHPFLLGSFKPLQSTICLLHSRETVMEVPDDLHIDKSNSKP